MNHKSKNTHHSGTALVELNTTLLCLPLISLLFPAEVESITEITTELRLSSNIGHNTDLKEGDEGQDLEESRSGDGVRSVDGGKAVGEGVEGLSGVVDVSGEVDSVTGHDLSKEGKLGNTSVLELDVTKTVEGLLVGVVKESKRSLGTKLFLEGTEGGGGLGDGGWGKGSSGGDGGGKDNRLHFGYWFERDN